MENLKGLFFPPKNNLPTRTNYPQVECSRLFLAFLWYFCVFRLKAIIRRHLLTRYLTPFHLLIKKNKLLEVSSAVHVHSSPSRRTRPAWLLRHGSCIERKPLFLSPANRIDTFKQRRRTPSQKHKTLFEPRFPRGPRGIKGAGRCCDLSFSRG